MSTSNPRSAKPVAMTLAPRSCPSCPILATNMRGRRPSRATNSSIYRIMPVCYSSLHQSFVVASTFLATTSNCFLSANSLLYAPEIIVSWATWRPKTYSQQKPFLRMDDPSRFQGILNIITKEFLSCLFHGLGYFAYGAASSRSLDGQGQ